MNSGLLKKSKDSKTMCCLMTQKKVSHGMQDDGCSGLWVCWLSVGYSELSLSLTHTELPTNLTSSLLDEVFVVQDYLNV